MPGGRVQDRCSGQAKSCVTWENLSLFGPSLHIKGLDHISFSFSLKDIYIYVMKLFVRKKLTVKKNLQGEVKILSFSLGTVLSTVCFSLQTFPMHRQACEYVQPLFKT